MATIQIADDDARKQYTQAVTANSTQLPIDFPFFSLDDIEVIVTSAAGVDNPNGPLTRGTGTNTFAVVGTAVDDGFSGGYITLGDTYSDAATKFTIFRDIPVARTTDFPTSGPFNISALNTELDKLFAIEQELETKVGRTMKLAESDDAATLSLPNKDTRKGKVLAFNATSGLPEAGPSLSDIATINAASADIALLADIQDGTTATNAITKVAAIDSNVTAVANIDNNVSTVAGLSAKVTTVADNNTNLGTVAGISNDVTAVANIATDIQTVEDNISVIQGAPANANTATTKAGEAAASATTAQNYAIKVDGAVESSNYSSKAWAVGGTGVTDTAGSGASKEWAVEQSGTVDGTEYSSKEYAIGTQSGQTSGSSKQWALGGGNSFATNTPVAGGLYSARYYAELAAASVDSFDDTYLGAKSSDPSTDNDGDALTAGDLYFSTTTNRLRVYSGSAWNDAVVDTTGFATNGFAIAMAIAL